MEINLNGVDGSTLSNVTSTQQGKTATAAVSGAQTDQEIGEDTATLSSDTSSVKALTAKAMESSQLRQDKIEALRQAIQNGNYKIEPDKIAEAMIRQSE
jgi:negative regulator of flagellin synthesis FlgM